MTMTRDEALVLLERLRVHAEETGAAQLVADSAPLESALAALSAGVWREPRPIEEAPEDDWVVVFGEMSKFGMVARKVFAYAPGAVEGQYEWEWIHPFTNDKTYVSLDRFTAWTPLPAAPEGE